MADATCKTCEHYSQPNPDVTDYGYCDVPVPVWADDCESCSNIVDAARSACTCAFYADA